MLESNKLVLWQIQLAVVGGWSSLNAERLQIGSCVVIVASWKVSMLVMWFEENSSSDFCCSLLPESATKKLLKFYCFMENWNKLKYQVLHFFTIINGGLFISQEHGAPGSASISFSTLVIWFSLRVISKSKGELSLDYVSIFFRKKYKNFEREI